MSEQMSLILIAGPDLVLIVQRSESEINEQAAKSKEIADKLRQLAAAAAANARKENNQPIRPSPVS